MPKAPVPVNHFFTAAIEKDGNLRHLRDRARLGGTVRHQATSQEAGRIDGHPFTAPLMPSATGPHWLPLKSPLCKAIDKNRAGEDLTFHIDQRLSRTANTDLVPKTLPDPTAEAG